MHGNDDHTTLFTHTFVLQGKQLVANREPHTLLLLGPGATSFAFYRYRSRKMDDIGLRRLLREAEIATVQWRETSDNNSAAAATASSSSRHGKDNVPLKHRAAAVIRAAHRYVLPNAMKADGGVIGRTTCVALVAAHELERVALRWDDAAVAAIGGSAAPIPSSVENAPAGPAAFVTPRANGSPRMTLPPYRSGPKATRLSEPTTTSQEEAAHAKSRDELLVEITRLVAELKDRASGVRDHLASGTHRITEAEKAVAAASSEVTRATTTANALAGGGGVASSSAAFLGKAAVLFHGVAALVIALLQWVLLVAVVIAVAGFILVVPRGSNPRASAV